MCHNIHVFFAFLSCFIAFCDDLTNGLLAFFYVLVKVSTSE